MLTHGELAARARGLALKLTAMGIGRGDIVAVALRKGWEQAVATLAVLQAGAAYLPLGATNTVVALFIATIKAALIAAIFMELRESQRLTLTFACAGFFLLMSVSAGQEAYALLLHGTPVMARVVAAGAHCRVNGQWVEQTKLPPPGPGDWIHRRKHRGCHAYLMVELDGKDGAPRRYELWRRVRHPDLIGKSIAVRYAEQDDLVVDDDGFLIGCGPVFAALVALAFAIAALLVPTALARRGQSVLHRAA